MTDLIRAPWTSEQVDALNRFQQEGGMHPFTCGALHSSGQSPVLDATHSGWICPDSSCEYMQDWAHAFMADPGAWPRFPFGGLRSVTPEGTNAATDATELDKSRRYLRPVQATIISDDPEGVHLAVYEWLPMFEAWATGPALCGESMKQGPLPVDTAVTCSRCEEWRPRYERMLAPGYRPEDDDPEALRRRAETAERQVKQTKALVAKWQEVAAETADAVILVGVAADVLMATLNGFNDLSSESGR